jgi:amidase
MEQLIYRSARALAAAIREKEISSTELVTACISRIEEVNQNINAVVHKTFQHAIEQLLPGTYHEFLVP